MKFNSIYLAVSLNFIAIALAAPTTTPSQETNNAADLTSNSLKARDFFGSVAAPVAVLVGGTLDDAFDSGVGSTVLTASGPSSGFGTNSPGTVTVDSGAYDDPALGGFSYGIGNAVSPDFGSAADDGSSY